MTVACLKYKHAISDNIVLRILKRNDFHSVKSTRKTNLTKLMREVRLAFCLLYKHWTLENWKRVIWTDETNVVLCKRNNTRIWRRANETYDPTCIRRRWKEYNEFMFWACYSYDFKKSCHVWKPALKTEKKQVKTRLTKMNAKCYEHAWNLDWGLILSAGVHLRTSVAWRTLLFLTFGLHVDICSLDQISSLCYLFSRHALYIIFDLHRDERCKIHTRYRDGQRVKKNKVVVNSWRFHF